MSSEPQNTTDYKAARDKFVAFSFAPADFLLEIDGESKVVFTAGSVQSLTGFDSPALVNKNWLDLFVDSDHANLQALIKGAKKAGRIGPILVNILHQNTKKTRAMITGMTIPESTNIYLSLNSTQAFFDFLDMTDFNDTRLLDEKQFEAAAMQAFKSAKKEGKNLDITFLESDQIDAYKKSLSVDDANSFNENFNAVLKESSYDSNAVSQIDEDKYAIIHEAEITPEFIEQKIQELVHRTTPEQKDFDLKTQTIDSDIENLNEREARRALIYTINQVEKNGAKAAEGGLKQGFDEYLQENASKIATLKKLVGLQAFKLHYQPIVYLDDERICHYEALVRFDGNESPYEMITFGEDIGLAPDIDTSIIKKAIGYTQSCLTQKEHVSVAVNVSAMSIQSEKFFETLIETLDETDVSPDNLMFEITESTEIGSLEEVNRRLQVLRERGFEICLDDFGAGAASFQYLHALDIDCVKIDGKYIRDALSSTRDEAMVRNLVRMCKDLGVTTIAEMVETEEQLKYLAGIGVDKAQGWLFGKPEAKANYQKRG